MKNLSLILTLLITLSTTSSFAQRWKALMNDPSVNIYEVVQEAEKYFQTVDKDAKGSGWKNYQRWLFDNEYKFYPSGNRSQIDPFFAEKAYLGFLNNLPSQKPLFNNGWEELGPHYIETVTGHYAVGLGRVETFYSDPNDPNRVYLGSRSGGFWRTLDGGISWTGSTTDALIASGVNTMAVTPTHPDSLLINIRNANNGTSHGIFRSVDAGDTWTITPFNPTNLSWGGLGTNNKLYTIEYHPTIPGLIFIGTSEGIYRSDDELATWTNPVPTLNFTAFAFHPTDPNIIYAVTTDNNNQIYVSADAGATFNLSGTIPGNNASLKISTTAAAPSCVYLGSNDGLWKSNDEAQNFTFIADPGLDNYGGFAVSDVDTNIILFGNIDTYMSINNGLSFTKTTNWSAGNANYYAVGNYVHADIRGAKCVNGVFWVNTDGLLAYSSDNGVTWGFYEGQSIRENYNLGVSQSNHERTICGSQDNGTSIKTETSWIEFYGADGMEGIIHPLNDDWMIGSLQNGGRRRTQDGGFTQLGVTPPGQSGAWIAPLFYDPNNQMRVYHLGDNVHRSDDFGTTWTTLGTPGFAGPIQYGTIAENNSGIILAVRNSQISKSTDGGNTFTSIISNLPLYAITDVVFDPKNDSTIVVTYGRYQNDNQKVYISHDQGGTWQNITYNLNNMPIRSVVIDHTNASTIYLGTEIGVYKKAMADSVWTLYSPDLPNMAILELEVMYGSNTLRAATWGRGIWEYTLDGRQGYPSILTTAITNPPTMTDPGAGIDQYVTSTITYDSSLTDVWVEWSVGTPVFGNVIPMSNTTGNTWVSDFPIPNQPANSLIYFKVFAVGSAGDTTETYKFMYELRLKEYCNSYGSMNFPTAITEVDFGGINKVTGKTAPYNDYTISDTAVVVLGNTYNLNVNLNTGGNNTIYAKAWIDWDQDITFDNATEAYNLGTAINTTNGATTLSPLSITVPLTAHLGHTRMRVTCLRNLTPAPCYTGFDGEVEDYMVKVVLPSGIQEVGNNTITIYPNPAHTTCTIQMQKPANSLEATLTNTLGQELLRRNGNNTSTMTLDIQHLPKGIYLLHLNLDGENAVMKVVKE